MITEKEHQLGLTCMVVDVPVGIDVPEHIRETQDGYPVSADLRISTTFVPPVTPISKCTLGLDSSYPFYWLQTILQGNTIIFTRFAGTFLQDLQPYSKK